MNSVPRSLEQLSPSNLSVAIVHYYFVNWRGGERVVEALCQLFPKADIFTLILDPDVLSPALRNHKVTASFLQRLPGSRRWYQHFLPLMPLALEQFDLREYDLVISSDSNPAKGVLTEPSTCHICYCHTPMRYAWDFYHEYKSRSSLGPLRQGAFALATHYARLWDRASADRVDYFVANSHNVARRIKKFYRREAEVIHPPVQVAEAHISNEIEDYYLIVGQLVAYKRADLAIEACKRLGRRLRVVGTGEEYKRLTKLSDGLVEFLGRLSDEEVRKQYEHCRALIFPGEEDFGMVPVEAQAFGRPVIAFGKGGACETVIGAEQGDSDLPPEMATGVFFHQQSADALCDTIQEFEAMEAKFSPEFIRSNAQRFSVEAFLDRTSRFVQSRLEEFRTQYCVPTRSRVSAAV